MAKDKNQPRPDNFFIGIPDKALDPYSPVSSRSINHDPLSDDLINFLSAARENRRARQVFEWETARRNSVVESV
ncbi:MAG: hypothetical protein J5I65_05145 [Aridibacter famidurans]|nr:hypothetical protein [Aridibacter famidurans]